MSGFSFQHHSWVIQWLFVFGQCWAITFPLRGVLHESYLLFIQSDSLLHDNLSTKWCRLIESVSFNDLLILLAIRQAFSHTSLRHEDSIMSLFQMYACEIWKSCIALKRRAFSQIYLESLNCHSENQQFHFHSQCEVWMVPSFHDKYCFWTN